MKTTRIASMTALVVFLAAGVVALAAGPGEAWHHGRAHVFVGVGVGPYYGPHYGPYPYWYGPPPAYVYSPPVVVQETPVYVQQQPAYVQPPAPATPAPTAYWYYCESAKAYYPYVPSCPETWVKVAPTQP